MNHVLLLQRRVRDSRAGYMQSLDVLREAKEVGVYTKSSIMLGLGETDDEVCHDSLENLDFTCANIWRMKVCPGIDSALRCLLQIIDTMVDLKEAGVDILTFGQYLQPTPQHLTVKDFITPEKFEHWRKYGEQVIGFRCCCRSTAPVVRISAARLPTQACIALGPALRRFTALHPSVALKCPHRYVASGPLVRSSYRAGEFFVEAMIKEDKSTMTSAAVA